MRTSNMMQTKNWMALVGLTCAAFIFNTSEFIPIGLLTDIANDFLTTEAQAGMIISIYAFVVMLLSLPLMIVVSRFEMKKLLSTVIFVFVGFQLLSAVSTSYYMLMLSRIGVACAHAIFWSIVSPLAVRTVPEKYKSLALSMIVTGTSVAMIFGLPIGRIIGLHIGWRMTFLCIGIFAFVLMIYLMLMLPKVPSRGTFLLQKLPFLFRKSILLDFFIISFAIATSYYTGYSYLEPFLKQVAGLQDNWITVTLVIFGAMGILGSLAFSRFYNKNPYKFTDFVLLGIFGCLMLLQAAACCCLTIILLCALWGMVFTASNVVLQAETINNSPVEATSVSMSIFSGIFNLGIACGTYIGGQVCTHFSMSDIGYAGAVLAFLTFIYWNKIIKKKMKEKAVCC